MISSTLFLIPLVAVLVTYGYVAYLDFRYHRIPFSTWFPLLLLASPFTAYYYGMLFSTYRDVFFMMFPLVTSLAGVFYLVGRFRLMGGADAMGLIFLTVTLPMYPLIPVTGYTGYEIFPLAVAINMVILAILLTPLLLTIDRPEGEDGEERRGIPLLVPLFLAIVTALLIGDIPSLLMKVLSLRG